LMFESNLKIHVNSSAPFFPLSILYHYIKKKKKKKKKNKYIKK